MKSVTIIVSHYESLAFLKACIRQIRKFKNPKVMQQIIICDQSEAVTHRVVMDLYDGNEDVIVVWTKPLYSGFGLDWIFRNIPIQTDYICQVHVDAYPISDKWLSMPITLIEESKLAFVGQLQCINQKENLAHIYPPSPFFAMAQCYNVAPTNVYRELAMIPGFTRFHNRPQAEMEWASGDWDLWAASDYNARGSDDDIVAFSWEDKHRKHDKLGLAISNFIEPSWGRIIEDVVFHFGSCREALGNLSAMPKRYIEYLNKINENYSDELIDEMVSLAKTNPPPQFEILSRNLWNGTTKESYPTNSVMNARIETLKNGN